MLPLIALAAGASALALIATSAKAAPAPSSKPALLPPKGGLPLANLPSPLANLPPPSIARALVAFTLKTVYWTKNGKIQRDKNKKPLTRLEVVESPEALAAQASKVLKRPVSETALVLAALLASEAGSGADIAKIAVAYAALTMAKKERVSILTQLIPDGRLGGQLGRYASTRIPPTMRDVAIAEAVLAGRVANPSPGAIQWDSPKTQDALARKGIKGYRKDSRQIAADRQAKGKRAVFLPGVDPQYLRLWAVA